MFIAVGTDILHSSYSLHEGLLSLASLFLPDKHLCVSISISPFQHYKQKCLKKKKKKKSKKNQTNLKAVGFFCFGLFISLLTGQLEWWQEMWFLQQKAHSLDSNPGRPQGRHNLCTLDQLTWGSLFSRFRAATNAYFLLNIHLPIISSKHLIHV